MILIYYVHVLGTPYTDNSSTRTLVHSPFVLYLDPEYIEAEICRYQVTLLQLA